MFRGASKYILTDRPLVGQYIFRNRCRVQHSPFTPTRLEFRRSLAETPRSPKAVKPRTRSDKGGTAPKTVCYHEKGIAREILKCSLDRRCCVMERLAAHVLYTLLGFTTSDTLQMLPTSALYVVHKHNIPILQRMALWRFYLDLQRI